MADISYDEQQKIYEDTRKNWELFYQGQIAQEKQYDKNIITLAAGSFGVSFAFIDKIVPIATAVYRPLLVGSWAFFCLALVVCLASFLISAHIHYNLGEQIKREGELFIHGEPVQKKKVSFMYNLVPLCNYFSFFAFLGGVVCLILFVLLNF
ncbi:hypothetical protein AGMMS4952_25370 [Spirochaetia bacterium]|nr:hypothetical protein AGMMS4952_25370 [Spirochaetia bacterium]